MRNWRLADRLRGFARRGLRPCTPAAFAFAAACITAATLLRLAVDLIAPGAVPFATYFPAVLVATLIGGLAAGIAAAALSTAVAWWIFVPPRFGWHAPTVQDAVSLVLFLLASAAIIWVAAQYRRMVRRLDAEERYRQVVVDELGHRVKNKLATVYAILHHELRGHRDIWENVAGRLRALSATDDFLVNSDGKGIDLRQILTLELEPYRAATVTLSGAPVALYDKLAVVLALVIHELATNAAKYGALSSPDGRIDIAWREQGDEVAIEWREAGGPPVTAPARRSFGSKLIERSLDSFGGAAKIEFAPTGVICRLTFPKQRFADTAPTARDSSALMV